MKLLLITLTILQSLLATLEQKTLVSDFTMTYTRSPIANSQPMTYTGNLVMHGRQFKLSMFSMEAAYDGKTLYMYSEDTEELTLSIPTEEELTQANPFLYAQALLPVCQYAEKSIGDKTQITLTPNDQSNGVGKFVLRVVTATLLPDVVEIHELGGNLTSLRLNSARFIEDIPTFTIEKADVFVNDLR